MPIEKLNATVQGFPDRTWNVDDVAKLRKAAGKRVNAEEAAWFRELLDGKWKSFSEPARRALEVIASKAAPDLEPTKLAYSRKFTTGIEEQSAISFVSPEHGFLLVDDETSCVWRVAQPAHDAKAGPLESVALRKDKGDMVGLESAAWDAETESLLACSEDGRQLFEMKLEGDKVRAPKMIGRLANIANQDNKGWEGMAILPAKFTDDKRARIVAVHEGFPMAIGIFDRKTLELEAVVELPETMDPMPRDLSDIAFDRKTGRFFLLSDESRCFWEIELRKTTQLLGAGPPLVEWGIVPLKNHRIPDVAGKDPQPEGIAVDQRGDVWVSCELDSALLKFARGI